MDFVFLKVILLLNSWLFSRGSLAMLQHATSSQSIVFHQQASSPAAAAVNPSPVEQYGGNKPKYEYKYEVSDHQTGDRKSHWESRDGDRVRGVYTLYEPDGALRTVEYTADALHGFNAVVKRDESTKHQHRPLNNYNQGFSNSVRDERPTSRYPAERSFSGQSNEAHPNSPYSDGVGFSVSHVVGLKKDNSVEPY